MVTGALNHRIPTHRFHMPPPRASVTVKLIESKRRFCPLLPSQLSPPTNTVYRHQKCNFSLNSPSSSTQKTRFNSSNRLYVSGLSFRTTEESLRNAFGNFGELIEVKLVMDKIANRPRGFAFLTYTTQEESKKAIEGMHGKFLDGRVIFVETAKPRPKN